MNYEEKLKQYISDQGINAQHLSFTQSCHSVAEAAEAAGVTPEQMLQMTGYPCGGTPSFGYEAIFLVDERALEKEVVYTGGGSENSLVKIAPQELLRANGGRVAKIRKS